MSDHQVIARKYRPLSFDDVVGQDAIARTLKNAISSGRIAHAYMFCGPRGVGKTSTARILARALNCLERPGPAIDPCGTCDLCVRATQGEDLDVLEIDAASNRKVDDARNLIANVSFHPSRARFKVYVVDEVHMLTTEAFNALLKTLEEPPPHVKFIFATTDPQKVPATILSRCQRFDFRPVPPADSAALLGRICASEGLVAEEAALLAVARASVGGLRDAQSLLEQLATLGNGAVRLDDLHALLGTVPAERMRRLFDTIRQSDVGATLHECGAILDAGTDPGELLRQAMHHARDLMLLRAAGPRAAEVGGDAAQRAALAQQAAALSEATLVYAITVLTETLKNVRLLGEGRLLAEAAFARLAGQGEMRFLDGLVRDLNRLEGRIAQLPDGGNASVAAPAATSSGPAKVQSGPESTSTTRRSDGGSSGGPRASAADVAPATSLATAFGFSAGSGSGPNPTRSGSTTPQTSIGVPLPTAAPIQGSQRSPRAERAVQVTAPQPPLAHSRTAATSPALAPPVARTEARPPVPSARSTSLSPAPSAPSVRPAQRAAQLSDPSLSDESAAALGGGSLAAAWDEAVPAAPAAGGHEDRASGAAPDDRPPERGLRALWSEVIETARGESSLLRTALAAARVQDEGADHVTLSVPQGMPMLRTALNDPQSGRKIRELLASVVGRDLKVRVVEREPDPEPERQDGPGRSAAERLQQRLSAADVDAIRQAPITKLIETELAGRIVHMERDA